MMKKLTIVFLILSQSLFAQKYFTKTGLTEFKASVDTFEPVEAKNTSTSVVLNIENGQIAALLFMKSFHFRVALMEEHFNENYIESNKFPKTTFKGTIENFSLNEIKNGTELKIKGTMNMRGVDKTIETVGNFSFSEGKLKLKAHFVVYPQDFNIKIPSIVRKKIAKEVNVYIDYELVEKK